MVEVSEGVYINIKKISGFTENTIYMNDGTIIELVEEFDLDEERRYE